MDDKEIEFLLRYKYLHYALGLLLIELRSAESLEKSQGLADAFHNVPAMISNGKDVSVIVEEIRLKAERNGVKSLVESIFRTSLKYAGEY